MKMKITQIAAALALGLAATGASAATATKNFNVKITITGTCDSAVFTGATVSDVSFGSNPSATGAVNLTATNGSTNTLSVACTKGTTVTVGLKPAGATAGASTGAGNMSNGTDLIPYQLTQPTAGGSPVAYTSAYVTDWGDIAGTNTISVVGQGMTNAIKLPVNAKITTANSLDVSAGNYTEAVTATLTY